jgi:hypothetical protein
VRLDCAEKQVGIVDARAKVLQEFGDEFRFAAKAGQQRQGNILSHPRFAPVLHCQTTDETERPLSLFAELLNLKRQPRQFIHRDQPS